MKFSDLHNPAAASKLIREFHKRFSSKVCLAPTTDCDGPIIAAHTLSVEGMLRPISRNRHVYTIEADLFNPQNGRPTKLALRGLRNTSVFNGFCTKHDKALFAPIEDMPFICSQEQLFLHAYRATAKEYYLRQRAAKSLVTPEAVGEIHGLAGDVELQTSAEALAVQTAWLLGAKDIELAKAKLDQYHSEAAWNRVMTTVIPFAKIPTLICNFV
jgi:hypothetical protein